MKHDQVKALRDVVASANTYWALRYIRKNWMWPEDDGGDYIDDHDQERLVEALDRLLELTPKEPPHA